jgi:DNA-binding winged helix-turn-helix (wHTH) protein
MAYPAMIPQPSRARLSFDGFELDEVDARLTCQGQSVPIPPRPFAVLCALARRPGHLLTKGDLLDAVWGHRFVTESVLKTAISDVRAALQDDPRQPRYIETVARRGYRFIVDAVDAPWRSSSGVEPDDAGGPGYPGLAALTALCRGDAALAELIRSVAATLESERLERCSSSSAAR